MNNFSKIVRVGTMDTGNGRRASIHCKIEYVSNRLSISGVIGALSNGNALGGCGQISMEFAHRNARDNDPRTYRPIQPSEISFAPGWNAETWYTFLDVWDRWHLNDMRAGDKHQEDILRAVGHGKDYTETCAILSDYNLYDDNGYRYGNAWNTEQVAADALEFLRSLPDADKLPAWI